MVNRKNSKLRVQSAKEDHRIFHKKSLLRFASVSVALVVSVLTFACTFEARPPRAVQTLEQIRVAGHLDLQGMQVKEMFLQQRNDKRYLFLRRADQNAFAIVDITNPNRPVLADTSALPELASGSMELPSPGSALAIVLVPEQSSTPAASGTLASDATLINETVQLIDLSDPREPKTMKVFHSVTSVASDDGRELVFLANKEGLWIVSHHQNRPLPMCTSESAIQPLPNCQ